MRVSVTDRLSVASTKPVGRGFLAVRANIARSGVYQYTRREIGLKDGDPNELIGVYRSPEFVFDEKSLATAAHKPVTINHPSNGVSDETWKLDSIGHSGGAVWEADDRKHVMVDMMLMDKSGIQKAKTTHKEISLGYSTNIRLEDGVSPEGEPYAAVMEGGYIVDHIACVPSGRAGHTCRIGDAAWNVEDESLTPKKEPSMKKLIFDGIAVSIDDHDAVESGVKKLEANLVDATAKAEAAAKALSDAEVAHAAALKDANDAKSKAEAEVASLTKELADSKVTPEQMREAAKAYAMVIDAAAKIAPDFKVEDSMTEADIRKGAILSVFGDAYKDKADTFFDALFEVEAAKVKDKQAPIADAYRQTMGDRKVVDIADAAQKAKAARDEMIAGFNKRNRADAE